MYFFSDFENILLSPESILVAHGEFYGSLKAAFLKKTTGKNPIAGKKHEWFNLGCKQAKSELRRVLREGGRSDVAPARFRYKTALAIAKRDWADNWKDSLAAARRIDNCSFWHITVHGSLDSVTIPCYHM